MSKILYISIIISSIAVCFFAADYIIFLLDAHVRQAAAKWTKFKILNYKKIKNKYFVTVIKEKKFFENIYNKALLKLKKAGYRNGKAVNTYVVLKYILPCIFFIIGAAGRTSIIQIIALSILPVVLVEIRINVLIKKMDRMFNMNAYKVYKYLYNQISAGIRVTDAVKTLHMVSDEKFLKNALTGFSAAYELTNDVNYAAKKLKEFYDTPEVESLCIAVREGVVTGDNSRILKKQEEIMFKKYMNYIEEETAKCKLKGAVSALFYSGIIIIMLLVPLIMETVDAVDNIFKM